MNLRTLLRAALVIGGIATSSTAAAQATERQPSFGPTIEAATAGVRADLRLDTTAPPTFDVRQQLRRSEVLMIVGGAIFLAGAIIGDDAGTIIMIGGAAIGIYGLYLYLQ